MLNLQYVTHAKPGAGKNEDLFGFKEDTFWMLDGATSTDGPVLERDAHWLVQEMDTALGNLCGQDLGLQEMAALACTHVADNWPSTATLRPVAAMALWRVRGGRLEMAITGNVSLLVYQGHTAAEYTDTRVLPAHKDASAPVLEALARGVRFESAEFKALRRTMKQQEAEALDIGANGWLVSPAPRVADDFLYFEVGAPGPITVLAATDGFMEIRRFLVSPSLKNFRKFVASPSLFDAVELLRTFERHPDSGREFPRTKRHDDATAVLATYGPTGPFRG